MDPRLGTAVIVVLGVPAVLIGYIWLPSTSSVFSVRAAATSAPLVVAGAGARLPLRLPRLPDYRHACRSFQDRRGTKFVGLDNYAWFFNATATLIALKNSLIWLVVLTGLTVGLGLLIAVLVDRVRYESVAKSVIFVPLAISMAASVIWTFMYDYQLHANPQVGTLNAALDAAGDRANRWRPDLPTSASTRSCS